MVRDILLLQQRELEKKLKERYVKRDGIPKNIGHDLVKVIIGPRRAGKSFCAIHLLSELGSFGYVNFDDERLIGEEDYDAIITTVHSLYPEAKYLLLDEIQNARRWEILVSRLQRQGHNLFITGSNAHLLSRELATHLTGRHMLIPILPFSFHERLGLEGKELTTTEMGEKWSAYLVEGGYPEPLVKGIDRRDYLATLFRSVLYKDVVKRFRIRSIQGMEDLALFLASNVAQEYSSTTLSKVTRCRSVHTVEAYLRYLDKAFLFFRVARYSRKVKEQATSPKKVYCIDNGLISATAFRMSPDHGKLLENAVAIALKRLELAGRASLYYWRNAGGEEVDFVVKEGTHVRQLIQVCADPSREKTVSREVRALLKASEELGCDDLLVITDDRESVERVSWFGITRKMRFIPAWKWALQEEVRG